jgi:hypothetical protein
MKLSIAISALLLVATPADARRLGSKSAKSAKSAKAEETKCPKSYSQTHDGKILLT